MRDGMRLAPNMPTLDDERQAGADRERPGPEQPHRYQRLVAHPPSTQTNAAEPGRTDDVAREGEPPEPQPGAPLLGHDQQTEPGRERGMLAPCQSMLWSRRTCGMRSTR